jgi:DNA-binding transcriptional LysR family regulator
MVMTRDPDLQQLKMFWMLARTGSFTRTARRMFRTQSAVSHAIAKLERSLGATLFVRRGRSITLTEEGRILLTACDEAFGAVDSAVEAIAHRRGSVIGVMRLGSTVEFGNTILMKHIQPFIKAHPEIELHFTMSHNLITPLRNDELDIIIDCEVHNDADLLGIPMFREIYAVICSPDYRSAHPVDSVMDLGQCAILSMDTRADWWYHFIYSLPEMQRPALNNIITINHIRGMVTAAKSGMGVALVPRYCVLNELDSGELVELFPELELLEDRFTIYQKKRNSNLVRHRLLTQYLQDIRPEEFGVWMGRRGD